LEVQGGGIKTFLVKPKGQPIGTALYERKADILNRPIRTHFQL
jgi:hypothetical protein